MYLMRCGETNYYKIGMSDDPEERRRSLQPANPHRLSVVNVCVVNSRHAALKIEAGAHAKLAEYNIHSEWFELTDDIVSQLQNEMIRSSDGWGL